VTAGRVRLADRRDLDLVTELWMTLAEHHVSLGDTFALRAGARDEVRALLAAQLRDPDAAVFVWERTSAGGDRERAHLTGLCIVRVDRAPPIHRVIERAEVTDLVVRKSARRQGIGAALLDAALAWVDERGVERVEVRVAAANAEGQAFWRSRGFGDLMDVLELHR